MTRDEANRRIAMLAEQSWLSRHPGATRTDYQVAAMFAAFGMADDDWAGRTEADSPLMAEASSILVQVDR